MKVGLGARGTACLPWSSKPPGDSKWLGPPGQASGEVGWRSRMPRWLGGVGRASWERSGSGENDEFRLGIGLMHGLGLVYPCGCGGEGHGQG